MLEITFFKLKKYFDLLSLFSAFLNNSMENTTV